MTPTGEQLCYTDAYRRTVGARVRQVEAGEATLVVLDRTVFYPGGGGQPSDRGLLLRAADGRSWTVRGAQEGRWRDRPRARTWRRRPAGDRRRRPGRSRLGAAPGADADPHGAARPVRRRLARLRRPGHRRQHGAGRRSHGLRVRIDERRSRRFDRGDRQRRARRGARGARECPARATRRSRSPT